ncbi:tRNA (adenosine(37)-N6)-threonylcarbamoyltransferase complex transferase subunit TsaD [Alkaliphilus serpentinus]|uniref:tRNA N6-adenosine threonylcarbamoyltransferase n=1 Tax=Alkaliphilus serpentinus TaxID=1482731 RepID=A0A833HQP7_9FIRM|nr:tRNA (adenosine(37)-N6)-threonylcarbamoyltransferase complex transferase subunit TsaD [Alkaliphilus serpentinus]KAB3532076.1 tRNA (adenosine(37)-N6)-threonylcarbamoyltransferase complex transferase subunit TsaD [Alkaliphilus serpentinus]
MEKTKDRVITLAIETSCDETSVSILENGRWVLSNIIASQIEQHQKFGGVVPEVASRKHIEVINQVIQQALQESKLDFSDVNHVAVTYGPGLVGALLVGVAAAKAIAFARGIPLNGVNHIEGHIYANFIEDKDLEPPFITLVVSGGHSHLVHVKDYGIYEVLGRTRDDAAGEAFDKIARALGLNYPGGPEIDRLAKVGDKYAIEFPKAYLEEGSYDFSFSGLKSAVLNYINSQKMKGNDIIAEDVAASFQRAVVEILAEKTIKCGIDKGVQTICLAGGVAANSSLRNHLKDLCSQHGIAFKYPSLKLCTDNAAMIGCVGYYDYIKGLRSPLSLNAVPSLKLGEGL